MTLSYQKMTHVEVAQPLQNGGVVLLGLAQQSGLLVLGLYHSQYFVVLVYSGGLCLAHRHRQGVASVSGCR